MRIRRRALTWSVALAGIAALATALAWPDAVDVEVTRVAVGPLRVTVDAQARARVRHRFVVTAPVTGELQRVTLRAGDMVRAGQTIARLAPLPLDSAGMSAARARMDAASAARDDAAAQLRHAALARDLAERAATRYRALEEVGGASRQQREEAELLFAAREQEMVSAQTRLRAATAEGAAARAALPGGHSSLVPVTAPATARVLSVLEESERVLPAGAPVMELGRDEDLEVVADVLSEDAVKVPANARVDLVGWGGAPSLRGAVRYVEPAARTHVSALGVEEQRVSVVIAPTSTVARLGDGFHMDAQIVLWEGQALRVPASAVVSERETQSVFVVSGGRARTRSVRVGRQSADAVEILTGLADGELVILFPSDRIHDGSRVQVRAPRVSVEGR